MSQQSIILEDPRLEYLPGALVEPAKATMLEAQGVITMPALSELFHHGAVAGFFRRDWGSGWSIPSMPGPCAPMVMFTVPGLPVINWCAKLIATPKLKKEMANGQHPIGLLRLVADGGQAGTSSVGLANTEQSVIDLSTMQAPADDGTWIVRGRAKMHAPTSSFVGYTLYGHAREMRVVWAAISQTES